MNKENLPGRYAGQITPDEYDVILRHARAFLEKRGTIKKIEDGVIHIELNEGYEGINQLALDNLIRYCKLAGDESGWKEIIDDHFERLTKKGGVDKTDFDQCRDLLSIRVYPEYEDKVRKLMIYKVDFPGTLSTLVLDLPDKYESIDKETLDLWGVPVDSLFYLAQENVNKREEIEIREGMKSDTEKIYSFLSADYSASFIRDIERNADFAVGTFGALVAIPTRGAAFAVPVFDKPAIALMDSFRPTVEKIFDDGPGNITKNIFWYDNGKFELVPVVDDRLVVPDRLREKIP